MLFSLLYFLVRRLLGAGGRLQDEEVELLVPRHQVKVLQRQVKRPRLNRLDRVFLAAARRAMTKSSWSSFVVRRRPCCAGTGNSSGRSGRIGRRVSPDGRRSIPTSGTSSSGSVGRTHAGATSGSAGSCASSGSGSPRRRSGRPCCELAWTLLPAGAAQPGPSSCGPRRRGSG